MERWIAGGKSPLYFSMEFQRPNSSKFHDGFFSATSLVAEVNVSWPDWEVHLWLKFDLCTPENLTRSLTRTTGEGCIR